MGPSLIPKLSEIHNNFLFNDYGSSFPIDHDDGSAFYRDSFNVFLYGGSKNLFGHSKTNDHQLFIYSDVQPGYGQPTCDGDFSGNGNYDDNWHDNKCLLLTHSTPYYWDSCNNKNVSQHTPPVANMFYTPTGNVTFVCNGQNFNLADWQSQGMDVGSTVQPLPKSETILTWARQLLFLTDGRRVQEETFQWKE